VYAAVLVAVALVLVGDSARRARQARSTTTLETGPVRPSAA